MTSKPTNPPNLNLAILPRITHASKLVSQRGGHTRIERSGEKERSKEKERGRQREWERERERKNELETRGEGVRTHERVCQSTKGGCTFPECIIIALEAGTRMPLNQSRSLGLGLQLHILSPSTSFTLPLYALPSPLRSRRALYSSKIWMWTVPYFWQATSCPT